MVKNSRDCNFINADKLMLAKIFRFYWSKEKI